MCDMNLSKIPRHGNPAILSNVFGAKKTAHRSGIPSFTRLMSRYAGLRWPFCGTRVSLYQQHHEAEGVIFDGSWLWEEYLWTLLKPLGFEHPENKKKKLERGNLSPGSNFTRIFFTVRLVPFLTPSINVVTIVIMAGRSMPNRFLCICFYLMRSTADWSNQMESRKTLKKLNAKTQMPSRQIGMTSF